MGTKAIQRGRDVCPESSWYTLGYGCLFLMLSPGACLVLALGTYLPLKKYNKAWIIPVGVVFIPIFLHFLVYMDASYTQCPSTHDVNARTDSDVQVQRWRGHTAQEHIPYNG